MAARDRNLMKKTVCVTVIIYLFCNKVILSLCDRAKQNTAPFEQAFPNMETGSSYLKKSR